jgi:hypothetical protein
LTLKPEVAVEAWIRIGLVHFSVGTRCVARIQWRNRSPLRPRCSISLTQRRPRSRSESHRRCDARIMALEIAGCNPRRSPSHRL